jgi:xanthine dehydrogenase YagR molybdenum-binding subunit
MNGESKGEPSLTGQGVNRIEGPLKVSGHAPYAADYPAEGLLHGVIVGSRIASGKILSIDAAAALAMPGVVAVFTHENRPSAGSIGMRYRDLVGPPGTPFRPLNDERILFAEQPIALVVADSYETARDAAALVRATYQEEPFETDLDRAVADAFVPTLPRPFVHRPPSPRGDAEGAFATAPFKIEAHYETAPEYHNPIELYATTAALGADGKMTVYDKNQGSQNVHLYLRLALGLRAMDLKVVNAYVGGAFGSGLRPAHTVFLAALLANHLGRSLRVVATRAQMFAITYRPHTRQVVELGCGTDGRLVALRHHAVGATSNYEDQQEVVVNWSGLAYACDNVKLSYEVARLATPTPADMRAPGAASGIFALECAVDELAELAGLDPLAFRLANWVEHDQNSGKEITAKALRECYAEGAERFGWARRPLHPRARREGHELVGWGMAGGIWEAAMAPLPSRARATWRLDGRLEIAAAASDIGTGTYTILAQIAAEAFGLEADQVAVILGDSSLPYNPIEGGSWMAASTGAAVARACDKLKRALLKAAQASHGVPRGARGVRFAGGKLLGDAIPGGALPIGEVLAAGGEPVAAMGTTMPQLMGPLRHVSYTHSATFAEVRVDEDLGVARVTRVVAAIAAGRILNPKTARSQILGGVVMGIGRALHEEGLFDHRFGRVMNASLGDYHIPTNADVYDIEVIFVKEDDPRASPLGVKGVGEIGIVGVAPAIANAIWHATGRRVRSLPITPDKLLG